MLLHRFFSIALTVWIGIGFTPQKNGVRVDAVPYLSPAAKAGVRIGDMIVAVDGRDFNGDPASNDKEFRDVITNHAAGDEVTLRILRDELVEIKVALEERPEGIGSAKEFSTFDSLPRIARPEEQLANRLIDQFKITADYKDLRQRLAQLSERGDQFRLSRVAYIQREPFQLRTVAQTTFDSLETAVSRRDMSMAFGLAATWLDASGIRPFTALKIGLSLDEHLDQLVDVLQQLRRTREEAFAKLTEDERKYLADNCDKLFDMFADAKDLDPRVLEIAARVDLTKLLESGQTLWRLSNDGYLDDLESAVRKAWQLAGRPEGIFINRDSPIGKIVVAGNGNTWHTEDAAILLDLGGKDFYTNNAGASRGDAMPGAVLIDFGGDDAYEATFPWAQGAGKMGHGVLIDRSGNDQYIGTQWAQGTAVLGTALFLDEAGNDTYRADQYAQAVASWGIAIHADYEGDDVYESRLLSQAVALPGGAGWLIDGRGNDRYYSKGKHATEYKDAGIFDSWSQSCGVGFRGYESGGVAILYDAAGIDRYEAGNFSQGGGYYFGIGLFKDGGRENDTYIGSRYNQGFAAHEAIGYFEEVGGNDFYTTRHAVAQGVSWDESIVAFIDRDGDDVYEGGASFSQGASAHNGFALFLDLAGRDRFVYPGQQGNAGPNDYHAGKSLSLFVSEGRESSIRGDYGIKVGLSRRELRGLH